MENVPVNLYMKRNGYSYGFYVLGYMRVASETDKSTLKLKFLTGHMIAKGTEIGL